MGLSQGLELIDGLRWYKVTTKYASGYVGIDREDRFTFGLAIWREFFQAWSFDNLIEVLSLGPVFKVVRIKASEVDHVHECDLCRSEWPCDELSTAKHPCRKKLCEAHK